MRLTTNNEQVRSFDVPGEARGWHTALYYFAEHVRSLSRGRINHKVLYSYVGTNGHYINHDNPTIRKRTAAVLSRLIHTRRYVEDFRTSYERDRRVFDEAARLLCVDLCENAGCDAEEALSYFCGVLWNDVERGFAHEREDGRTELNLDRIACEMRALFSWCATRPQRESKSLLVVLASCYFHLMTFGHLNERFMYELADETPLETPEDTGADCAGAKGVVRDDCACLIKYEGGNVGALSHWWVVPADRPFTIGRYTDSDIIEPNRFVSRQHCRIVSQGGSWYLEDRDSRHGSHVLRNGHVAYDSDRDGGGPFELAFGDCVVLAGTSRYWFGALLDDDEVFRG